MKFAPLIAPACGMLAGNTAAQAREHRTDMSESRYRPDHAWSDGPSSERSERSRHRSRQNEHRADDEDEEDY